MAIKSDEIISILKSQIAGFDGSAESRTVGTVVEVGDGIAQVYGLSGALSSELLEFPGGVAGMALNLGEETVGAVLLGDAKSIKEGDTVKTTGRVVEVPVGPELIGRVVDPLGRPLDGKGPINAKKSRPVERIAPGVISRKSVTTPVQTGIKAVDALIPIGRGQRELIIGDRQTGKTAVAIDTIINQKGKGLICVYVAIGQKLSTVRTVVAMLEKQGAMGHTVVVVAGAEDPAPLQYLAPFAGCAIAEEIMEVGVTVDGKEVRDALCVYDDLSKHAVAYREMALSFADHQDAKRTQATSSICTADSLSALRDSPMIWVAVQSPRCQSLRRRRVTFRRTSQPTSSPSRTARSSLKPTSSTQVSDRR